MLEIAKKNKIERFYKCDFCSSLELYLVREDISTIIFSVCKRHKNTLLKNYKIINPNKGIVKIWCKYYDCSCNVCNKKGTNWLIFSYTKSIPKYTEYFICNKKTCFEFVKMQIC